MSSHNVGLLIAAVGVALVVLGLLIWSGAFAWFGKLPGDIRIKGENVRIYIPFTSMAILSLGLTALINLIRRLFS